MIFEPSLMLTAWIAANVYAYVHGHTRTHLAINFKISRRDSWSTTHRGWTTTTINCSNALNFMTSTDAIAAKNAFVLITNLFVIGTRLFVVMKFKALGVFSRKSILGLRLIVI